VRTFLRPYSLLTRKNTGNFGSSPIGTRAKCRFRGAFGENVGSARNRNRILAGAVSGNAEEANRENGDFRRLKCDGTFAGVVHLADVYAPVGAASNEQGNPASNRHNCGTNEEASVAPSTSARKPYRTVACCRIENGWAIGGIVLHCPPSFR
jgi:hypothetical protein